MIGKSTKKQFAAKVSAFWSTPQNLLEIYTWIFQKVFNENLPNFTTNSPNKGFNEPDQPENHREEREEGK